MCGGPFQNVSLRLVASAFVAFVALLAAGLGASGSGAGAETPPRLWQGVTHLHIMCLGATDRGVDGEFTGAICARARTLAAQGAPVPVDVLPLGDPRVLATDSLTLLIHVSVRSAPSGRLAALSVRPFRNANDAPMLFAAAPRAALLPPSAAPADALSGDLRIALGETLPWLSGPPTARPIHR